jgi:transketolase
VRSVNGNDIEALVGVFDQTPFVAGKPNLIIAETTKGKGISFIEDAAEWHHHVPTATELATALAELDHAEQRRQEYYATATSR